MDGCDVRMYSEDGFVAVSRLHDEIEGSVALASVMQVCALDCVRVDSPCSPMCSLCPLSVLLQTSRCLHLLQQRMSLALAPWRDDDPTPSLNNTGVRGCLCASPKLRMFLLGFDHRLDFGNV